MLYMGSHGLGRTPFSISSFHGKLLLLKPQFRKSYRLVIRSMSTAAASTPTTPRPSASLVIINERNEILLVHRNPQARHFGGVYVGGIEIQAVVPYINNVSNLSHRSFREAM